MATRLLKKYAQAILTITASGIEKTTPRLNLEVEGDKAKSVLDSAVNHLSTWGAFQLFVASNDRDGSVVHIVSIDEIKSLITMEFAEDVVSVFDPGSTKGLTIDTDGEGSICITCWGGSESLIELLQKQIPDAVVFLAN